MKSILMSLCMIAAMSAQASILTFTEGSKTLENVNLSAQAKTDTGTTLDLLGAGLRNKKVLIVNAKVYVLQIFSDNKAGFSRDANALSSLVNNSKTIALKISMLRTVDAPSLAVSFKEAIQANGYAIDAEIQKLLKVVETGAEGTQGKDLLLVLSKTSDPKTVLFQYQDSKGKIVSLNTEIASLSKVLAIWLGKPADSGLAALKEQLLKAVY